MPEVKTLSGTADPGIIPTTATQLEVLPLVANELPVQCYPYVDGFPCILGSGAVYATVSREEETSSCHLGLNC